MTGPSARPARLPMILVASALLAFPGRASTAQDAPRGVATLRPGDNGPAVEGLQRALNARLSPSPELDVDGDFGDGTKTALVRYQRSKGLPPSGLADPATLAALGPPPPPEAAPPPPEVVNARPVVKQEADPLDGPPFTLAPAWAVADGKTGETLWGRDEAASREPASTTKIMTALVVLRLAQADPKVLDEVVTFSERADRTPGSTSGLHAGERLPVRDLLYGLLLPSGNDAAEAFAEHFGPRLAGVEKPGEAVEPPARFVAEMNRVAAVLGLRETHFANPHGLPAAGHRTSARDLARLAHAALADPTFAAIVATPARGAAPVHARDESRNVVWKNTNHLLPIRGYDGVKTGTTAAAGACLVASGRRDDDRLIVVVLGAPTSEARYVDARNLFRWAWSQRGLQGR